MVVGGRARNWLIRAPCSLHSFYEWASFHISPVNAPPLRCAANVRFRPIADVSFHLWRSRIALAGLMRRVGQALYRLNAINRDSVGSPIKSGQKVASADKLNFVIARTGPSWGPRKGFAFQLKTDAKWVGLHAVLPADWRKE
jgi:hypothetical protein